MVSILIVAYFLGGALQLFSIGVDELDIVVVIVILVYIRIVVDRQFLGLLLFFGFVVSSFFQVLESIVVILFFFLTRHCQNGYRWSRIGLLVFRGLF